MGCPADFKRLHPWLYFDVENSSALIQMSEILARCKQQYLDKQWFNIKKYSVSKRTQSVQPSTHKISVPILCYCASIVGSSQICTIKCEGQTKLSRMQQMIDPSCLI